ncbi:MAG TPA: hypothetical protein VMW18_07530 [Candidatus Binatia bacterium]|nr:hypothetical protein [Candidatus Binatia bacterium]
MVEISMIELEMHVAAAMEARGVHAHRVAIVPDGVEGGWRIAGDFFAPASQVDFATASGQVEAELGAKFRLRRPARNGVYGG